VKRACWCAAVAISLALAGEAPEPAGQVSPSKREQAEALLLRGKPAEAAALFAAAVAEAPADASAMAGRVRALVAADDWRKAVDEARRYADLVPGSPDVRAALGAALFRAGRLPEAAAAVDPLVRASDAPVGALVTAGLLRSAEGRADEAAGLLDRAVTAAPRDRTVLYWAAGAAGSRARTIELLTRYLEVSEGDDGDKIEGAKGTLELYRALAERPIWIPESRPERLELPLRALASRPGAPDGFVVEAVVTGGRKLPLLLDSGSTGLFVVERIAKRAEFQPLSSETVFGGGGEGRTASRRGLLPAFALGDLSYRDGLATSSRHEVDPTGRFHGVLGLWLFDGYQITLDLRRGRVLLEKPGEGDAGSPYWVVGGQMLVEAQATDGQSGLFLFDTGATTTVLSRSLAEASPKARIGSATTVRGYGGDMKGAATVRGLSVAFQGLTPRTMPLNAVDLTLRSRLGGVEISGFLGLDLLHDAVVVVNTRTRRISVTKAGK
jgi:tetratricopeptide (TPR) repeat protein